MAHVIKCINCCKTLKEEGDEGKGFNREYRVYSNMWNCKIEADKYRIIECLECGHICKGSTIPPV